VYANYVIKDLKHSAGGCIASSMQVCLGFLFQALTGTHIALSAEGVEYVRTVGSANPD